MSFRRSFRTLFLIFFSALLFTSCSTFTRTGRKQKFLKSGKEYAAKGKYQEAVIQFLNAIQLDARYTEAHYELGKAALQLGDARTAYFEFQQTTQLDPDNMDAQVQFGNLLLSRGQTAEAREKAELVLGKQPSNADAHMLLAQCHAAVGESKKAFDEASQAMSLAPNRPEPYVVMASLQSKDNQPSAAEASYRRAIQVGPRNVDALLGLASLLQAQRRWVEAENVLKQAISTAPTDPQPRLLLAVMYLLKNDRDKAKAVAVKAASDMPTNPVAYRMVGDYYVWVGDVQNAENEYAALYKAHGSDVQVKKTYCQLLILTDHVDQADKINGDLLAVVGDDPDVLVQRGEIQLKRGQPDSAAVTLRKALRFDSNNYLAHYYLGLALSMTGDLEGGQREWQEAAHLQPGRSEPQIALAGIARVRGDRQLMDEASSRLLKLAPTSAVSYLVRARTEFARDNKPEAERIIQQAIRIDPANPLSYAMLGEYRILQKRWADAEQLLEQSLAKDPNYYPALQTLAAMYASQGQMPKALARVDRQIQLSPGNSYFHLLRGALEMNNGALPSAEQSFRQAVNLSPKNRQAWSLLVDVLKRRGASVDDIMATCKQWANANSDDARPDVLIGQIYESRGDWQNAQTSYLKALDIDRRNPVAANNLSYIMLEHNGSVSQAMSYALQAREGLPGSPIALDTLGWAYCRNGDYELAVDVLKQALAKMPENPNVHFHLGIAYEKLKDVANAKAHLDKALELDPKYIHADDIRQALTQLQQQKKSTS